MTGYCCCWPMNSLGHLHAAHNLKLLKRCSKIGQQEGGETQSTGDNWRLLITIRENWNKINIVFMGEREKTRNRVVCEMSNKATVRPSVIVSCPVFSHWFHSFHFDVGCWQPKHTTNQAIAAGEERIEDEGWWWGLAMRKINIGERFFLVQCFFFVQDLTKSKSSSWQASAFIWSSHFTRPVVVVVIVEPSREMLTWREKVENEREASMRGEVKRNNIGEKKTSRWSLKMSESCFLMAGHNKPSVLVLFLCAHLTAPDIYRSEKRRRICAEYTREKIMLERRWCESEREVKC